MARSRKLTIVLAGEDKGARKALAGIDKKSGVLGKTFKGLKVAAIAAGAAIVGIGAVGVGLAKLGADFDKAFDTIRVGTGATGKALEGLKTDFKEVLKDTPASFEDAGQAIADLNTRLGLSGKPLRRVATQMLDLSRITETDLGGNIEAITRLFGDWSVATGDQSAAMDEIFRASQATGITVTRLSELMVQFGSPLRQLGLDFETTAAMFGEFEKSGVNIQTVLPGLRQGLKNFAEAGRDPAKALAETIDAIREAGSTAEANTIAFDTFGARAGADLAAAVREGRFDLDELIDTIKNGGDTISDAAADTESFGEKWARLKNRVFVALEPLATAAFEAVGNAMDAVGPHIENLISGFTDLADTWIPKVREAVEPVVEWVKDNWPKVRDTMVQAGKEVADFWAEEWQPAMVAVFEGVTGWVEDNWPDFRDTVTAGLEDVTGWVDRNWPPIRAAVLDAFEGIKAWVDTNWPAIRDTIVDALTIIRAVVGAVVTAIRFIWDNFGSQITAAVVAVWGFVKNTIESVLGVIRGIIHTVASLIRGDWGEAWEGIRLIVESALQLIMGFVQFGVDSIKVVISTALQIVKTTFQTQWNIVKGIVSSVWDAIGDKVTAALGFVKNAILGALSFLRNNWKTIIPIFGGPMGQVVALVIANIDRIVGFFRDLPVRLRGLLGDLGSAASAIGRTIGRNIKNAIASALRGAVTLAGDIGGALIDAFKAAINAGIDAVNRFIPNSLGVNVAGRRIGFDLPDSPIPRLAHGGVAKATPGGILARIAEGGRDEAVVPLPPGFDARDLGGGGGDTFIVNLSGAIISSEADAERWVTAALNRAAAKGRPITLRGRKL